MKLIAEESLAAFVGGSSLCTKALMETESSRPRFREDAIVDLKLIENHHLHKRLVRIKSKGQQAASDQQALLL
jgi:hypothetical protein